MPKAVEQVTSMVGQLFDMGASESQDAIGLLKQDHRKVEALFSEFEKASSNKQSILNQIIKELSIHATVEENLVYPLCEDIDKIAEDTAEAYEEHHVVKMMLAELADIPAEKEVVAAKVRVLCELVKHHVKEEERDLLPQLKKNGVDLDRLAEDILRRKQQLMAGVASGGGIGKNKDIKAKASSSTTRKPAGKKTVKKSTAKKTTKPAAKTTAQAKRNTSMKTNRKKSA
jgi:hemerythrin superfamily protein